MATTTAMCATYKAELAQGYHCHLTSVATAGTVVSTQFTVTSIGSTAGLAVGMPASGTNIAAGAVIASIDSATQVTLSKAHTGSSSPTITYAGDVFAIALIKVAPAGTYGSASTNYSNITGNSDEVSGTGYTAGGFVWTGAQNTSPAVTSSTAFWSWSVNPSWTSATISTTAGMIYNQSARGPTNNRAVGTFDFGGTQTVTAGTLTLVLPTNNSSTAILRIS